MKSKYEELAALLYSNDLAALLYSNDTCHHHDKKLKRATPEPDVPKPVPKKLEKRNVLKLAIATIKASIAFIILS